MKRKFFVDPSGGSPKIDKPIIDPLKLRKKNWKIKINLIL